MVGRASACALAAVAALSLALAFPRSASAHALLQTSNPASGATVRTPPSQVTIQFGERPDPALSQIRVLDVSGQQWSRGPTMADPVNPLILRVALKPLTKGVYTVTWRTVSAVDGHLAAGAYAFGYLETPGPVTAPASGAAPSPGALAIGGRWLLLAGISLLLGLALVALLCYPSAPVALVYLLPVGWIGLAAGSVLVPLSQMLDSGAALSVYAGTSPGRVGLMRLAVAVLTLLLLLPALAPRALRLGIVGGAAGAALATAVDVGASHAAAYAPVALNFAVQLVHGLASTTWIGGVLALVVSLRGLPDAEKAAAAKRFSSFAAALIATVAGTGLWRAIVNVASWDGLIHTAYGQVVLAKVGVFLVLALLGAFNHWLNVPNAALNLVRLRRAAGTEVALGTAVFGLTAGLVNLAPPVSAPPPAPVVPLVAAGADFGTTVRLRLVISPGTAGFDHFTAYVTDYDTGQAVSVSDVSLTFNFATRPGVGTSTLDLKPRGRTYEADGANLSLDGTWRIAALIPRGAQSVEVDLSVTTHPLAQKIDVQQVPGLPTLYTVHLQQGGTVQFYVDPSRPGPSNFHATFFQASGQEQAIDSIEMWVTPPRAGTATLLSPLRIDAGHFTGVFQAESGTFRFDVVAQTPTGDQLAAHVDIRIV